MTKSSPARIIRRELIKKRINVEDLTITVKELYDEFSTGKLIVLHVWLQRMCRKSNWQLKEWKAVKEYLEAFFHGESNIQPFYKVSIDVLLSQVEEDMEYVTANLSKEAYKEIVDSLKKQKGDGAEYVLLDGQNRLVVCLLEFFNSTMKFTNYPNGFDIETADIKETEDKNGDIHYSFNKLEFKKTLNDFQFEDLKDTLFKDPDNNTKYSQSQWAFWNTPVDMKVCLSGKLSDIVKSLVNLNKNSSWGEIEHALVEVKPLSYRINRAIFMNALIIALFGNVESARNIGFKPKNKLKKDAVPNPDLNGELNDQQLWKGHVSDFSGGYELEKKGHGRFLCELIYYVVKKGQNGFGGEPILCQMIRNSDQSDASLIAHDKVKDFLEWVSKSYACLATPDLIKANKPFSREFLRSLLIMIEIMTDKDHSHHYKSPIKLAKGVKQISKGKELIEELLAWHLKKKDPKKKTVNSGSKVVYKNSDFDDYGAPLSGTYAADTLSAASADCQKDRADHIFGFINENFGRWIKNNYFHDADSLRGTVSEHTREAARRSTGGLDGYTGEPLSRKVSSHVEHIISLNGPSRGINPKTGEPTEILMTNKETNLEKSSKI
ncbi:MAG: hypothetical protein QF864_05495 [SAR202 cluster bacterium]|nr:hypothetical protein [SAR202 cluster bacterium]